MDLEKLKEIEDLKTKKAQLIANLANKIKASLELVFPPAIADFESFFVDQGFKFVKSNQEYFATYGQEKIKLTILPSPHRGKALAINLPTAYSSINAYNIDVRYFEKKIEDIYRLALECVGKLYFANGSDSL